VYIASLPADKELIIEPL